LRWREYDDEDRAHDEEAHEAGLCGAGRGEDLGEGAAVTLDAVDEEDWGFVLDVFSEV